MSIETVTVWLARVGEWATAVDWLPPSEQAEAERRRFGREETLLARVLARAALSHAAGGVPPGDWQFARSRHGKPYVVGPRPEWRFNVSHSDGVVACAVSDRYDVGVDVERRDRVNDLLGIARRYFAAAEVAQLTGDARRRFFEIWTLKEAYVKARGDGLTLPLDRFAFTPSGETAAVKFAAGFHGGAAAWTFVLKDLGGHQLAVAVPAACRVEVRGAGEMRADLGSRPRRVE